MVQLHRGYLITLLTFLVFLALTFGQSWRLKNYCEQLQSGMTIMEARIKADKAMHHYQLVSPSELLIRLPTVLPVTTQCRAFFNSYRTLAGAFFESSAG